MWAQGFDLCDQAWQLAFLYWLALLFCLSSIETGSCLWPWLALLTRLVPDSVICLTLPPEVWGLKAHHHHSQLASSSLCFLDLFTLCYSTAMNWPTGALCGSGAPSAFSTGRLWREAKLGMGTMPVILALGRLEGHTFETDWSAKQDPGSKTGMGKVSGGRSFYGTGVRPPLSPISS